VAAELASGWHTVNEATITYGQALLEADRKRLNQTTAVGLAETFVVRVRQWALMTDLLLGRRPSTIGSIRRRSGDEEWPHS
jgi:hypothetical protein